MLRIALFVVLPLLVLAMAYARAAEPGKIVIAHRGASGYLPEHTLAAKAMAYAMGAHYLEQDVVLTRDDRAIVLHDIHLETVTDVAERFPGRARADGRYYTIDFDLAEIQQLRASERFDPRTGQAVFAGRFPLAKSRFFIPTLEEEIELVQGLNQTTGRDVGIYVELKAPQWHTGEGKDIARIVLDILQRYGYRSKSDRAFIQCFDPGTLKRLKFELGTGLPLIQLLAENIWQESTADYEWLKSAKGLDEIATYAVGIGPWINQIVTGRDADGSLRTTTLVADAHARGLLVHPFTFRADAMPPAFTDFDAMLHTFFVEIGVDGVFTDFPDRAVQVLESNR